MAETKLSIVLEADVASALKSLEGASESIKKIAVSGAKNLKEIEAALTDLRKLRAGAETAEDLNKINFAISQLSAQAARLRKPVDDAAVGVSKLAKTTANANPTLVNFGRVLQDAPFGIIGIANNIDPLLSSFQSLKRESGSTGGALKALFSSLAGPAGIAIGISAVTSALIAFGPQIKAFFSGVKQADEATLKFREEIGKQSAQISGLVGILKSASFSYDDKRKAIGELRKQFPGYLKDLSDEQLLTNNAALAIQLSAQAILNRAKARLEEEKIAKRTIRLQEIESSVGGIKDQIRKTQREYDLLANTTDANTLASERYSAKLSIAETRLTELRSKLKNIVDEYTNLKAANETAAERVATLTALDLKSAFATNNQANASNNLQKALSQEALERQKLDLIAQQEIARIDELTRKRKEANIALVTAAPAGIQAATQPVGLPSVGIPSEITKVQNEQAQRSADVIERIGLATTNANAAFGLLNPIIDQTFAALANGEDAFKAIGQGVKRLIVDLIKAVAQAAILSAIMNAILPGSSKAAGGFSGIFKGLLGFGGNRAAGGSVVGGMSYVVGERGPEIFTPSQAGTVLPNVGAGGGTLTATVSGSDLLFILNQAQGNRGRNFA